MPDRCYKLLPKALADLEGIWLYSVNKWGIEQTEQYLSELDQAFLFLSENPKICPERQELTPARPYFPPGQAFDHIPYKRGPYCDYSHPA